MEEFWKKKLAAYLHDPPSKIVEIRNHEKNAKTLYHQAGFSELEATSKGSTGYTRESDWAASSADRFPFPHYHFLTSVFDGKRACFHHPLSGEEIGFHKEIESTEAAMEVDSTVQPADPETTSGDGNNTNWKAKFFTHWRLWEPFACRKDYRFALLPADTRLPDHKIWNHMQIVSALNGCSEKADKIDVLKPAFLKFQIGPVQDFIAEARSIRDLWSGSYLLSWLVSSGLKHLALSVGPDSVIFPNLKGQALFDFQLKDGFYDQIELNSKSLWDHITGQYEDLHGTDSSGSEKPNTGIDRDALIPNLPNVFLAVVPAVNAEKIAEEVEQTITNEWKLIADSVWEFLKNKGLVAGMAGNEQDLKSRFDSQIARQLQISWQVTEWPQSLKDAIALANGFDKDMPIAEANDKVTTIKNFAEETMDENHRDRRYYTKDGKLNNIGLAWSVIMARNSWELDAVRQARTFDARQAGAFSTGKTNEKDSLNGRDEMVLGGEEFVKAVENSDKHIQSLFKHSQDNYGAITLVKRTWHTAYLGGKKQMKTSSNSFPIPNTHGIARHDPFSKDEDDGERSGQEEKYFAVLALDGDQIGKWVSGEKSPHFRTQLSYYSDEGGKQKFGSRYYFENLGETGKAILECRRPLSPSYHLQFSEALSNFATLCAGPVVEVFDGRLIYAGGDDVLALLPSDTALACAEALRMAFRGDPNLQDYLKKHAKNLAKPHSESKKTSTNYYQALAEKGQLLAKADNCASGFLTRLDEANLSIDNSKKRFSDYLGKPIPFIVPGSSSSAHSADCSVGIAMAHFKSPLQDVVKEAQKAEKRAKRAIEKGGYGRSAFALSLFKRSGEIVHWGSRWANHGLQTYQQLSDLIGLGAVSSKFPHRLIELLEPLTTQWKQFDSSSSPGQEMENERVDALSTVEAVNLLEKYIDLVLERQKGPHFESHKENLGTWKTEMMNYAGSLLNTSGEDASVSRAYQEIIGLLTSCAFAVRSQQPKMNAKEGKNQ